MLEAGGAGLSRLGGHALLPRGTAWPRYQDRALTHLASVALREVPSDLEDRSLLPDDGALAFFADLSEEGEFFEPLGPDWDPIDGRVALVYSSEDDVVEISSPDGDALQLDERRVGLIPRLQVRPPDFQGDPVDRELLEKLARTLNGGWEGVHQLLGHPGVAQEDPLDRDDVALFHLSPDPVIGFEFLDAGDLLVFGPRETIQNRRWDGLTWWPSSC
jgi:hypothetical protein